jgi:stress response protein YsnF
MDQTVIGVFDTKKQAVSAKQALETASFNKVDHQTFGERGRYDDRHASSTDSVYAFFGNMFDDDDDAARGYAEVARRGTVVSVYTDTMDQAKKAATILDQNGAIDLDERLSSYEGYEDEDLSDDVIKVIEEDIAVGKREIQTGSASVRSRIVVKPVQETLRLREEHIVIDRKPVDRTAKTVDFKTGSITLKETAEEAVVAKDARVVEEIRVGKKVDTRTETIDETVRETEVDVTEKEGKVVREYESKNN